MRLEAGTRPLSLLQSSSCAQHWEATGHPDPCPLPRSPSVPLALYSYDLGHLVAYCSTHPVERLESITYACSFEMEKLGLRRLVWRAHGHQATPGPSSPAQALRCLCPELHLEHPFLDKNFRPCEWWAPVFKHWTRTVEEPDVGQQLGGRSCISPG